MKKKPTNAIKIIFNGVEYQSKKEISEKYGIEYGLFHKRMSRGYSLEECIYGKKKNIINYNGESYNSLRDLAIKLNLEYYTLKGRLKRGYSLEEAVNWDDIVNSPYSIMYNDILYKSEKHMCDELCVSYSTFNVRKKRELPLEECVVRKRPKKTYEIDGKKYNTLSQISIDCNVNKKSLYYYMKNGMSVVDAVNKLKKLNKYYDK